MLRSFPENFKRKSRVASARLRAQEVSQAYRQAAAARTRDLPDRNGHDGEKNGQVSQERRRDGSVAEVFRKGRECFGARGKFPTSAFQN